MYTWMTSRDNEVFDGVYIKERDPRHTSLLFFSIYIPKPFCCLAVHSFIDAKNRLGTREKQQ